MVHRDEHDRLASLYEVVKGKGPYLTLLESLDAMGFDREACKTYAEHTVRAFWKARNQDS